MKSEIDETNEQTPEDVYKLGKVFVAEDRNLYLVAHLADNIGFCLINLTLDKVAVTASTLSDLIKNEYQATDKLIDVKIVRA